MRIRILGCLVGLLAATTLTWAQTPTIQPLTWPGAGIPSSGVPVSGDHAWSASEAFAEEDCGGGPPGRVWLSGEYLLWWFRSYSVPPLVTTGPLVAPSPGVLGQPGTSVLLGGGNIGENPHSGFSITGGFWLEDTKTIGLEGNYFGFVPASQSTTLSSDGTAVLARPIPVILGVPGPTGEVTEVFGAPGFVSGSISVSHTSQLQGTGLNGLFNVYSSCNARLDLLGGFRFLQLNERLSIGGTSQLFPTAALPPPLPGSTFLINDQFSTTNRFYGGVLGARGEIWSNMLFVRLTGTLGLGATTQQLAINGSTQFLQSDGTSTFAPGGLLALPSNIGNYSRTGFSVVPQIDFKTGVALGDNLRIFAGYTFLYWTSIARPGDQIDRAVNLALVPGIQFPPGPVTLPPAVGPVRPVAVFNDKNFWAQGINLGVELRF